SLVVAHDQRIGGVMIVPPDVPADELVVKKCSQEEHLPASSNGVVQQLQATIAVGNGQALLPEGPDDEIEQAGEKLWALDLAHHDITALRLLDVLPAIVMQLVPLSPFTPLEIEHPGLAMLYRKAATGHDSLIEPVPGQLEIGDPFP